MDFDSSFGSSLVLRSDRVLLRSLQPADLNELRLISGDPSLWHWFTRRLNEPGELETWLQESIDQRTARVRFPFTVIDLTGAESAADSRVAGSSSFGNISFPDKRIEIGWTWYGNHFRGSGINLHCKLLMLQYAFEKLCFERVEFKTDALNNRSRAALIKIGAKEEGILRSHMLMPGNRRRDSVYFSVLREEWPEVKQRLHLLISSL